MAKRVYNRHYRMTAARRAALRKAQIASARKRRRNKKIIKTAKTAGVIAVTVAAGGGSYVRAKRRRASINVVSTTMHNASNPVGATKALPAAWSKEVDTERWTYKNQVYGDDDVMDYGRIGKQKPGYKQSFLPRHKPKGKANTHTKGKRINTVLPDGTVLAGARARWTYKQGLNYSYGKRHKRYVDARDSPTPPRWLDPYGKKLKARDDALKAKRKANRARKRGTG